MEKIIQEDGERILRGFYETDDLKQKEQYAYDYMGLNDILKAFFNCYEQLSLYDGMLDSFVLKRKKINKETRKITSEVYANLDTLEKIYEDILRFYQELPLDRQPSNTILDNDALEMINSFLKKYHLDKEYETIKNHNHLFYLQNTNRAAAVHLRSLNEHYLFVPRKDEKTLYGAKDLDLIKSIAHEMGHVHANNLISDGNYPDCHFLVEFMSIFMEVLFLDHFSEYDNEKALEEMKDYAFNLYLVIREAYCQIKLMQLVPDSVSSMKVDPVYYGLLDRLCCMNYNFKRYSLEIHYYALGFLLALSFRAKMKDCSLEEVEEFYRKNVNKNNLSEILKNISLSDVKEYINNTLGNTVVKKK